MKKILSQILCLCLLFTMTACSNKTNQEDIVTVFKAFNQTLNAKSGKMKGTITYTTDYEQIIDYDVEFIQTGNMQVKANMSLEAEGNRIDDYLSFYIKDGKTYLNYMGTTSKSVASNIGIDTTKTLSVVNPFLDFTDSELKSLFTSSSKEGNVYTLKVDTYKLATLLDGLGSLNIDTANIVATVDDNHISNLEIVIYGNLAYEDNKSTMDVKITCAIDEFNTLKEVTFPDDLDTY